MATAAELLNRTVCTVHYITLSTSFQGHVGQGLVGRSASFMVIRMLEAELECVNMVQEVKTSREYDNNNLMWDELLMRLVLTVRCHRPNPITHL